MRPPNSSHPDTAGYQFHTARGNRARCPDGIPPTVAWPAAACLRLAIQPLSRGPAHQPHCQPRARARPRRAAAFRRARPERLVWQLQYAHCPVPATHTRLARRARPSDGETEDVRVEVHRRVKIVRKELHSQRRLHHRMVAHLAALI